MASRKEDFLLLDFLLTDFQRFHSAAGKVDRLGNQKDAQNVITFNNLYTVNITVITLAVKNHLEIETGIG